MAQVTKSLVDEWKRALGAKLTPAFTTNEFDQLCFAWEECRRLRAAAQQARTALSSLIASGDRVVFSDALRALDEALGDSAHEHRELEKEAARYRWLRDHSEPGICAFYLSVGKAFDGVKFTKQTVDEAIDAQIALQALNDQAQELGLYSGEKP